MIEELHVEDEHEESFDLQVLVNENVVEDVGQTFVLLEKWIQEDMPFRYWSKYTYFSMDWIYKYITEM